MKNKIVKLSTLLLSLALLLSPALPVLAAESVPASDYAVLELHYRPGGNAPVDAEGNGVVFRAYQVAAPVTGEDGNTVYQLTDRYTDDESGTLQKLVDDLNGSYTGADRLLYGSDDAQNSKYDVYGAERYAIPFDYTVVSAWIRAFGGYINSNSEYRNTASDDRAGYSTGENAVTEAETNANGDATFTGLADGIYLVASNQGYILNGVQYVAAPFIIQIPYVDQTGASNNYITGNVKWFTPQTPTGGGGTGTTPVTPENPTPPDAADAPDAAEPPVDIGDEDVPLADEPEIELLDDPVPLADMPDDEPLIELPEDPVPLGNLPQTGQLWWPVPVMAVLGAGLLAVGAVKRKSAHEE